MCDKNRGATESLFLYFPGQDNFLSLNPCRRQNPGQDAIFEDFVFNSSNY